jgi:hypothetical protein
MIANDSPLRHLPVDVGARQILFFDILRLSAEMLDLAYHYLGRLLDELVKDPQASLGNRAVLGLLHAYSIVDAANRFRDALRVMPGLKHNDIYESFMRSTTAVDDLRNVVQHINTELPKIEMRRTAALGTLTWLGPARPAGQLPSAWILQAGTFYPNQLTFGPVIDQQMIMESDEVTAITLTTSGAQLNLTDLRLRVADMIHSVENALSDHVVGKETLGSDVLLTLTFHPVDKPSVESESDDRSAAYRLVGKSRG